MPTPTLLLHWQDVAVCAVYASGVALTLRLLRSPQPLDGETYFLADRRLPAWLAAMSLIATMQSAATFIGIPDYAFKHDFTYLTFGLSMLIGTWLATWIFLPRFQASQVRTVYDLLALRFGTAIVGPASVAFLLGRLLSEGTKLYLAGVALAVISTGGHAEAAVLACIAFVAAGSLALVLRGGLRAVVWFDALNLLVYVAAALVLLGSAWTLIDSPLAVVLEGLRHDPSGVDKLRVFDLSLQLDRPFSLLSAVTGLALMHLAAIAFDHANAQRLIACRSLLDARRSAWGGTVGMLVIFTLMLVVGATLYVVYARPDLVGGTALGSAGDMAVTMHFALTHAPPGVRGIALLGLLAATITTTMSGINAMAAVLVGMRGPCAPARAGGSGVGNLSASVCTGSAIAGVAIAALYVHRIYATSLIEFSMAANAMAYAGLAGVFLLALVRQRGSAGSAVAALVLGPVVALLLQPAVLHVLPIPGVPADLAFSWSAAAGTAAAFLAGISCRARPPAGQLQMPA